MRSLPSRSANRGHKFARRELCRIERSSGFTKLDNEPLRIIQASGADICLPGKIEDNARHTRLRFRHTYPAQAFIIDLHAGGTPLSEFRNSPGKVEEDTFRTRDVVGRILEVARNFDDDAGCLFA